MRLLHRLALEQHGGQDGLRDPAAFSSAVLQPQNLWYYEEADLFAVAGGYAFYLAEAQAFVDGNKRTGMAAALVFLDLNGHPIPEATEELYALMIGLAKRTHTRHDLALLFKRLAGV